MHQLNMDVFKDFQNLTEHEWISDLLPQPKKVFINKVSSIIDNSEIDIPKNKYHQTLIMFNMPNDANFITYFNGVYWVSDFIGDWADYIYPDEANMLTLSRDFVTLIEKILPA